MKPAFVPVIAAILVLTGCAATSNTSSNNGNRTLRSIQVESTSSSVAVGLTAQLTATGTYNDGSSQDVTATVTWLSSNTSLATITTGGLVQAKAQGAVTFTASMGSIQGKTNVSVGPALIASLNSVSPASARMAAHTKEQFQAMATMTDGTTQNVSDLVSWTITGNVAAITNTIPKGWITAGSPAAPTTVTVTATCSTGCPAKSGQLSISTSLTVTNALATAIAVTPASQTIGWGTQVQMSALGSFDDGSTQDITASCAWTSAKPSILFVTTNSGLGIGKGVGNTTVQAAFDGVVSNAASIAVDLSNLRSIAISPTTAMVAKGTQIQFAAIGTFQDGSTRNLYPTNAVSWSTTDTSVATILPTGIAQGVGSGSTAITTVIATVSAGTNTFNGTASLDVENATLNSIAAAPATSTIPLNAQLAFTALGTFSGSNCSCQFQETITGQQQGTTWSSNSTAVSVNTQGVATGHSSGTALITASSSLPPGGVVSNAASLNVSTATLAQIKVSPANTFVPPGANLQFSATGYYSDNSTQNLSQQVTWSATPSSVATIASWGQATGQGAGNATITASCSNLSTSTCNPGGQVALSGTSSLLVTAASLASIVITPSSPNIAAGTATQLTAIGHFSNNTTQDLTGSVNWSSATHSVATIGGQTGILNALSAGQSVITATFGGVVGSTTVTVSNAVLQSIDVTPNPASISLGGSQTFSALGHFQEGTTQTTQNLINVNWNSSNPNVAIVSGFGQAVSSGQTGTTAISATLNGVSGTAYLTVH